MYRSFIFSASLLSFIPTVIAAGSAHVINNCGIDVYYASVAQNVHAELQKLPSEGYSESYSKENVGISIKLATSPSGPVTQFEFTLGSPNIYYDISNIDGNPFAQYGTSLVPSLAGAAGYPSCVALSCPAGQAVCQDAYNDPNDVKTKVCPDTSDLTFTLCPGGASPNTPVQSSASSSSLATSASVIASVPVSSVNIPPFQSTASPNLPSVTASPTPSEIPSSRSSATQFRPTSFRTSTTPAAPTGFTGSVPAANLPVVSSGQDLGASTSSVFESPSPVVSTATGVDDGTRTTASPGGHSWSWGNWKNYHTHRARVSGFRL